MENLEEELEVGGTFELHTSTTQFSQISELASLFLTSFNQLLFLKHWLSFTWDKQELIYKVV